MNSFPSVFFPHRFRPFQMSTEIGHGHQIVYTGTADTLFASIKATEYKFSVEGKFKVFPINSQIKRKTFTDVSCEGTKHAGSLELLLKKWGGTRSAPTLFLVYTGI